MRMILPLPRECTRRANSDPKTGVLALRLIFASHLEKARDRCNGHRHDDESQREPDTDFRYRHGFSAVDEWKFVLVEGMEHEFHANEREDRCEIGRASCRERV